MKKGTKKALVFGGIALGALVLTPIIINYFRPTGTVNPNMPLSPGVMPDVVTNDVWRTAIPRRSVQGFRR